MSLLGLPPELLECIFSYVGPGTFRKNSKSLLISRRWYIFASRALYNNPCLSTNALCLLTSSSRALRLVKNETRCLTLHIDYSSATLEQDLSGLGAKLQKGLKYRALCVSSSISPSLSASSLEGLLAVQLTSLELDVPGFELDQHICPTIGALLPKLIRLRLCLRELCLDAVPAGLHDLPIQDLIINLGLGHHGTEHCQTKETHGLPDQLRQRLSGLGVRSLPRVMRLLWQDLPSQRLSSLDLLTGVLETAEEDPFWDSCEGFRSESEASSPA